MELLGGLAFACMLISLLYWAVWCPIRWMWRKIFILPPNVGTSTYHYPEKLYYHEGTFRVVIRAMKDDYWGSNEEYLNGFAKVSIFSYPEDWERRNSDEKPIKQLYATYFRDQAKKHWWQTGRYRHVEEVAEELKNWVRREIARTCSEQEREGALRLIEKERRKKLGAQAKSMADEFHSGVSVSGALSKVDDVGGELSVAQNGEVSLAKKESAQ